MSTETKAQHTVPQSYLRRFTSTPLTQKQSKMMIWAYDKASGEARQQKVKNVSYENKFYDFKRTDGSEASIEGILAEIENPFSLAISAVCADLSERAILRHQVPLAHFVACQLLRTTAFRQQLRDMADLFDDVFQREGTTPPFEHPDENDHALFQTRFMLEQMTPLAAMLCNKAWMLLPNDTGVSYWTSDHPVFMHNSSKDPYKSTL